MRRLFPFLLAFALAALPVPPHATARASRPGDPGGRAGRALRSDTLGGTALVMRGESLGDRFGDPVVCAGDVNGDGFDDLLIGAWAYSGVAPEAGRVYLHLGSPAGVDTLPVWEKGYQNPGAKFGLSLAGVGDLDGDGFDEVLIGAGRDSIAQEGRAFLFRGTPSGLDTVSSWTQRGQVTHSWFGTSVASAGDLNGDGYPDVAIGAPNYPGPGGRPGAVFVYYGTGAGLGTTPTVIPGELDGSWFGYSVGRAGDVNSDGFEDLLVGAVYASHPTEWEGRAYLYLGSASGIATTPAWAVDSDNLGAGLGNAVGRAGDVNADGFDDVLVGAHHFDTSGVAPREGQGRAFLFFGSAAGLSPAAPWWITGRNIQAHLGRAVGFAGDVNHDGIDDMYVATLRYSGTHFSEGRLEVFYGHAGTGPSTVADWGYSPGELKLALGQSMAASMDLNGDGAVDVAGGSSGPSEGVSPVYGEVHVIYGMPPPLGVPPHAAPSGVTLAAPSPNPLQAGAVATIRFTLPAQSRVRLVLHDAQGRVRSRLLDGMREAGRHSVRFDGRDPAGVSLAPGLYFLALEVEGRLASRRIAIVR